MAEKKATKATAVANETIVIKAMIKTLQVYNANDAVRYRATLDQEIVAIVRDRDTEEYNEGTVDYIDFVPSVLIAQCINHIEGLDIMYTKKKEAGIRNGNSSGFGAAELSVVLKGAKLTIERTKFNAGDEYTTNSGETLTHENAGYNTNITGIKVSEKNQVRLDKLIDSVFDL